MSPRRKSARPEIAAMTRSELTVALADQQRVSRLEAEMVVDTFFETILRALEDGDRVELRGFGTFQTKAYGGYTGRNPATGEAVTVDPKVLPVFRLGRELQERLLQDPADRAPLPPPPRLKPVSNHNSPFLPAPSSGFLDFEAGEDDDGYTDIGSIAGDLL